MESNSRLLSALKETWLHDLPSDTPDIFRADYRAFTSTFLNYANHDTDAMKTPSWLEKTKAEVASKLPSSLPEGRTVFNAATMTEPKMSGKFRKYSFQCTTKAGTIINLSVSPTLLGRILEVVEGGHDFAITKQGSGIDTNYVVEALA